MNAISPILTPAVAVDQLGLIKSQIAALEAQEKALREILVNANQFAISGQMYDATVSHTTVTTVPTADMKAYIGRTEAGRRWLKAHEQETPRTTVKVVARTAPREANAA